MYVRPYPVDCTSPVAVCRFRACLIKNVADRVAYPETFFVLSRRSVPGYMTEGQDEKRPGYARQRKLEHIDGLEKMYLRC